MKKFFFIPVLIIICTFLNSKEVKIIDNNEYNGKTQIVTFNEIEQEKSKLVQQNIYFDNNNKLKKVENFFIKKLSDETKIVKQIDYYNADQITVKFELIFNNEYSIQRNIDKTIEYVDEKDKLIKTEYYKNNIMIYFESVEKIDNYKKTQFLSLNFFQDYVLNSYRNNKDKDKKTEFVLIDKWYLSGKAAVNITGEIKDLNEDDKLFIEEIWNKSLPALKYDNYYKKISVSENNNNFWIIINENDYKNLKINKTGLIIFYCGGFNGKPVFMCYDIVYD